MRVLPPSMMLAALLLLAALQPAQLCKAPHHRCLLRSNSTAVNGRGRSLHSVPQPTADDCARACKRNDMCDTFAYDGSTCRLRSWAYVKPGPADSTAGWCPDEKKQQEWRGVSITPAPAPYKCSNSTSDVCRFPFKLHGNLHWDCVERDGTPVCNTKDSGSLPSFDSTETFQPCTECANCPQKGTGYYGFLLTNTAGNDIYNGVTSSEECQALCQLVNGCSFFNYSKSGKWCNLLYGVGNKYTGEPDVSFGPKHCSTNSAGTTATSTTTTTTKTTTTTTLETHVVTDGTSAGGGLEAMKHEILREMRKEITKAKQEIIDVIRLELSRFENQD